MREVVSILVMVSLMCMSCKYDKATEQVHAEKKETLPPIHAQKTDTKEVKKEHPFMKVFSIYVEEVHCGNSDNSAKRCYELHESIMRSDAINQVSASINFPYNKQFDWEPLKSHPEFDKYWSYKCGFMYEGTNTVVNYYCPNVESELGLWLQSHAIDNYLFELFIKEYYKTADITQPLHQEFILDSKKYLDFDNVDHRAFYWMYHLTLAEARQAQIRFQALGQQTQ